MDVGSEANWSVLDRAKKSADGWDGLSPERLLRHACGFRRPGGAARRDARVR